MDIPTGNAFQGNDTIGEWTVAQLVQFLKTQQEDNPPLKSSQMTCDELIVVNKAQFYDRPQFYQYQNTVGAAGTASALPANPLGYIKAIDRNGTAIVIPYYTA